MGVSESFGTNITENHFGNLSALFFGQSLNQMGQKCPHLAENANFGRFWAKSPIFGGKGVKLLVPSCQETNETPFSFKNINR